MDTVRRKLMLVTIGTERVKKKLNEGLNHSQLGPSTAVVITAIIKYCLTSL